MLDGRTASEQSGGYAVWPAVSKEPRLEWFDGTMSNRHTVFVMAKPVAPELIKVARSEQTDVPMYVAVN